MAPIIEEDGIWSSFNIGTAMSKPLSVATVPADQLDGSLQQIGEEIRHLLWKIANRQKF
jgi:hypothetical protein